MIIKEKIIKIDGMTCVNCETKIQKNISNTAGIREAKVSYTRGTAYVKYDLDIIKYNDIKRIIENLDYQVIEGERKEENTFTRLAGIFIVILAIYMLLKHLGILNIFNTFPQANEGVQYGMLFIIGLLTSVHCIAMCGGINLSQCIPKSVQTNGGGSKIAALRPSFLYNLGRVISYTVIGGIVGAVGSAVSFSGEAKGIIQILAGIFMVIMGLNMLNIFPFLRRLNLRMPRIFARKIDSEKSGNHSPLYIGLLNGLMPCGPLQAMQLYALSTGSPLKGAFAMLLFSLGTVPLMFGLGALSSVLSKKFTKKIMTVGAVLVVVLGAIMFSRGMSLSGLAIPIISAQSGNAAESQVQDGVQIVNTTLSSGRYEPIKVKAGIPVKWTITADSQDINGCNNIMEISEYNIEKKLEPGENVIEFTPTKAGEFRYSCWMGMIRSTITVTE